MEEEVKTTGEVELIDKMQKAELSKNKEDSTKVIIYGLLILILLGVSVSASYWWRDKTANEFEKQQNTNITSMQKTITSLEKQLVAEKAKNAGTATANKTVCTAVSPSASVIESIKASITSGNTAALEGYMATSVNVILAATEAYGPQTSAQAVSDITHFISDATSPWDFALSASILSSYGQGGYSQYFPNIAVVGKSANKKVISFSFDCNAKISTVLLASNENILE
jgi:cytoskeletal protein RodZ